MQIQLNKLQCSHPSAQVHLVEVNEDDDFDLEYNIDLAPLYVKAYFDAFEDDHLASKEVMNAYIISEVVEEEWFLDSDTSSHVTGNPNLLSQMTSSRIPSIRTIGGHVMPVASQGIVTSIDDKGKIKQINPVLYVPGITTNLFSVGKLIDSSYRVMFESKQCLIYDKDRPTRIFLQGIWDGRNNLYKVVNRFEKSIDRQTSKPILITQAITS